jgi:hypothetical protein
MLTKSGSHLLSCSNSIYIMPTVKLLNKSIYQKGDSYNSQIIERTIEKDSNQNANS